MPHQITIIQDLWAAYLVYTSEPTGYPKGVLHSHRSLVEELLLLNIGLILEKMTELCTLVNL